MERAQQVVDLALSVWAHHPVVVTAVAGCALSNRMGLGLVRAGASHFAPGCSAAPTP